MNYRIRLSVLSLLLITQNVIAGAWGYGSFENDSAADWVYELEGAKNAQYLLTVFNAIPKKSYIDMDTCAAAIGAAEVTASLKDGNITKLPKEASTWVIANKESFKSNFSIKALEALELCKSTKHSELAQLWNESSPKQWLESVSEVEIRLK